jgi:hypothetical protein
LPTAIVLPVSSYMYDLDKAVRLERPFIRIEGQSSIISMVFLAGVFSDNPIDHIFGARRALDI